MKKRLINYTEDKVEIPSRLYSGLVRSLAWKIEYQSRIEKATEFLQDLDSLDTEQFYILEEILKGEHKIMNEILSEMWNDFEQLIEEADQIIKSAKGE